MPALGADFGIILAYLIPGFLTLWAAKHVCAPIQNLFNHAQESEKRAVTFLALTVSCLATGMFLSIVRASTVDKSFALPLCSGADGSTCKATSRVDPDFVALACEGLREAFLLAEARDKRPYQFYGNMVLALTIAVILIGLKRDGRSSPQPPLWRRSGGKCLPILVAAWLAAVVPFYWAARTSHYRFMKAVSGINNARCCSESTATLSVSGFHVPGT
jgi:hypothetical protein